MSPSSAITIDDQLDPSDQTVIYNPFFTPQTNSTKVDGNGETTIRLLAGASKAFGAVTTNAIRFWTPANLGWLDVTVPVQAGVALYEWTPPNLVGNVAVHAQAVGSGGVPLGAADITSIDTTPDQNLNQATSIDGALRERKGYFINVAGGGVFAAFTGDHGGPATPDLRAMSHTAAPGPFAPTTFTSTADANGLRNWAGVANVAGLVTPIVDGDDDLVVQIRSVSDVNAQVYTSYQQIIAVGSPTLVVEAGSTSNVSGDSDGPGGQPINNNYSFYTLTLKDQEGRPVAGATVYETNAAGANTDCNADFVNAAGGVISTSQATTDGTGKLRIRMEEQDIDNGACDFNPAPGAQRAWLNVDANGDGDYDAGTDTLLQVNQTNVAAAPANVTITGSKGDNLDDDETHNVTIKVTDADGNPSVGTSVVLRIAQDNKSNPGDSTGLVNPGIILPATNAQGEITLFGADSNMVNGTNYDNDWVLQTYEVTAGTVTTSKVFQWDQSELNWTGSQTLHDETTVQGQNGTTIEATGDLTLENSGAPLPNRLVGHRYFRSADANGAGPGVVLGNSGYLPAQPAGTVSGTPTTATSTTSATGGFAVRITDPAAPNGEELNSKSIVDAIGLSIDTDALDGVVDNTFNYGTRDGIPVGAQAWVSDILDVDFLRSLDVSDLRIINNNTNSQADGLLNGVDGGGNLTPGATGKGRVEARNADGVLLVNKSVNLTIEEGHFVTDYQATPVPGQPLDFNDAGQAITVNTGPFGLGQFVTNIERHVGFDDDGEVDDNMTAASGAANDVHDLTWTTEGGIPLNQGPGDLTTAFSDPNESSILPEARGGNVQDSVDGGGDGNGSGQVVDFDVNTVDQFGNRTSQPIGVSDKSNPLAGAAARTGESEFELTQPAAQAWNKPAGDVDQTLEIELTGARKVVYNDNAATSAFDPAAPLFPVVTQPQDIEQDTDTINWYAIDFLNSAFSLGQQGPNTVAVGTLVTEVVRVLDQKGQAVEGLGVDFLRGGPSAEDDDGCFDDNLEPCIFTNSDGEAFYDFVGGSPGTATVTVVVYDDDFDRVRTVGPDTVQFANPQIREHINALLSGRSSQGRDILKVNAPSIAEGAKVRLQKRANGKWVTVKVKFLDGSGDRKIGVKDRNGKKVTKYRAKVSGTANTFKDTTPFVRLK